MVAGSRVYGPFSDFWQAIRKSVEEDKTPDESTLILPEGVHLLDSVGPSVSVGSTLFVRKCYPRLAKTLKAVEDAMLVGTPGLGKTLFRNYYIRYLTKNHTGDLVIIVHSTAEAGRHVFLTRIEGKYEVYEAHSDFENAFLDIVPKTCPTWYLVDVRGDTRNVQPFESSSTYPFFRVIFTSPNDDVINTYKTLPTTLFTMPLWTYHELRAANALLPMQANSQSSSSSSPLIQQSAPTSTNLVQSQISFISLEVSPGASEAASLTPAPGPVRVSDAVLDERFERYGGVIRAVLGSEAVQQKHKTRVDGAIALFQTEQAAVVGTDAKSKSTRHCLIYTHPILTHADKDLKSEARELKMKTFDHLALFDKTIADPDVVIPPSLTFQGTTPQFWGTRSILQAVAALVMDRLLHRTSNFFNDLRQENNASVQGALYEEICHQLITSVGLDFGAGNRFAIKSWMGEFLQPFYNAFTQSGSPLRFQLPYMLRSKHVQWFRTNRMNAAADLIGAQDLRYLRPSSSNYPAVDAIVKVEVKVDGKKKVHLVGFQFTVAGKHEVKDGNHQLNHLMQDLGIDTLHLIWVPRPSDFERWEPHSVTSLATSEFTPTVYQYVLDLSDRG